MRFGFSKFYFKETRFVNFFSGQELSVFTVSVLQSINQISYLIQLYTFLSLKIRKTQKYFFF